MVNYQNGKIYKIECNVTGSVYIGSTCENMLCRRLAGHVVDYKAYKRDGKKYLTSYEVLKNDDYNIYLIELFPCNSKDELHAREGHHIKSNDCVNKVIAGRTMKEYLTDNKDKRANNSREHYIKNKDKICDRTNEYKMKNKDKIREHYMKNKDKINEKQREQYIKNKDKIREKCKIKMHCVCGSKFRIVGKSSHNRTKKHIEYIENLSS